MCADLGAGQWAAEGVSDRTHQQCARSGCQQQTPLPLQLRGGQTGQVLGSRV